MREHMSRTRARCDDRRPRPAVVGARDRQDNMAVFESTSGRTGVRDDGRVRELTTVSGRSQGADEAG